jgi:hypothetical protein
MFEQQDRHHPQMPRMLGIILMPRRIHQPGAAIDLLQSVDLDDELDLLRQSCETCVHNAPNCHCSGEKHVQYQGNEEARAGSPYDDVRAHPLGIGPPA